nr:MAG TPA: prohead serine protease [Caudoviricetes sp.]
MTATECVLTRSNVCPYMGHEVPDYEQLGLEPERVYYLYRDPVALKAAVSSLNGKPLLLDHVLVSASDPQKSLQVGTVVDCRWAGDRIVGTVVVWDQKAIDAIESRELRDLSCGYRYSAVKQSGVAPDGDRYDLLMTGPIEWNHVALVRIGRVEGAFVADSAPDQRAEVARLIPHLDRL